MKTILAATDFSAASHNACLYAAALAEAFRARLVLFHAWQRASVPVTETPAPVAPEFMNILAEQSLTDEAARLRKQFTLTVQAMCQEGPATDTILKAVEETNAGLVITGMKEDKGFRRLFGSTVTALINKSKAPLIVVPELVKYVPVANIALANESDVEPDADAHLLDALREIAERFHSRLYLVRIAKSRFNETYEIRNRPFRLNKMMRTLDPVYKCVEGKDVTHALNDFIKGHRIDMLAMMPHRHTLLERWFTKSTTRAMVFETHIPLLILPELQAPKTMSSPATKEESL